MKKKNDLGFKQLIGYGSFGFGANSVGGILAAFLTLYLTDNLLLSAAFIAGLMLVGRIANAITEMLMGFIIDRTHTRIGKARPWILGTAFMTAFPVFLIFNTPASLGETGVKVWVVVTYLLHTAVFGAAISVAYSTLLVKISSNSESRTKLTNLSNLLGQIANLIASSYGIPILMYFGGYETGYRWMSLIFSTVGFIAMLLTGIMCRENEDIAGPIPKMEGEQPDSGLSVMEQTKLVFTSRYVLPILIFYILYFFATMLIGSVTVYYVRDVMGDVSYMTPISYAKIVPIIAIGLLGIVPRVVQKLGKGYSLMIGSGILLAGTVVPMFAPSSVIFVMIGNVGFGAGSAFLGALLGATVADIADYVNYKNGIDVSGLISSVSYIGMRAGMALGSVGIMVALHLGKYNAEAANQGLAQAASAIFTHKICYLYIPAVCCLLMIVISRFLHVDAALKEMKANREEKL